MRQLSIFLILIFGLGSAVVGHAQEIDTGVNVDVKTQKSDTPGVHIKIHSDNVEPEEVKQKLKAVIDALATKVKQKVDSEVTVDVGEVTQEDIQELEELRDMIEKSDWDTDSVGESIGEALITIIAIVFSLGMPIIILLLVLIFGSRKRKQKMELISGFINRDQPVPPELLREFDAGASDPLRSGLQWVMVGLGIVLAFSIMGETEVAALGLIPLGLGAARLIYWKLKPATE